MEKLEHCLARLDMLRGGLATASGLGDTRRPSPEKEAACGRFRQSGVGRAGSRAAQGRGERGGSLNSAEDGLVAVLGAGE